MFLSVPPAAKPRERLFGRPRALTSRATEDW